MNIWIAIDRNISLKYNKIDYLSIFIANLLKFFGKYVIKSDYGLKYSLICKNAEIVLPKSINTFMSVSLLKHSINPRIRIKRF